MSICWNKAVRKLLKLPYNSHCRFLSSLIKCDPFSVSHCKRSAKFLKQGIINKNDLISYVFKRALLLKTGFIGNNVLQMYSLFNITHYDFYSRDIVYLLHCITDKVKLNADDNNIIDMAKELIDECVTITRFSDEERSDIISHLLTI